LSCKTLKKEKPTELMTKVQKGAIRTALKQNSSTVDLRGVTPDGSTFRVTFPIK
jgi:hypothetical protein